MRSLRSQISNFNSRPSARGDFLPQRLSFPCCYFNSRPSARGDAHSAKIAMYCRISIHAPPRGATARKTADRPEMRISIHAPPRGATNLDHAISTLMDDFNSRPSARGDHIALRGVAHPDEFQFTPLREGRRNIVDCQRQRKGHFNSRPSARGDMSESLQLFIRGYFNSRPSARGDNAAIAACNAAVISIHAPPRGATASRGVPHPTKPDFNSRPSARGDDYWAERIEIELISIHAPPRGATFSRLANLSDMLFQFTPLREGRRFCLCYERPAITISIHAPPRGATLSICTPPVVEWIFQFTPLREGRRV